MSLFDVERANPCTNSVLELFGSSTNTLTGKGRAQVLDSIASAHLIRAFSTFSTFKNDESTAPDRSIGFSPGDNGLPSSIPAIEPATYPSLYEQPFQFESPAPRLINPVAEDPIQNGAHQDTTNDGLEQLLTPESVPTDRSSTFITSSSATSPFTHISSQDTDTSPAQTTSATPPFTCTHCGNAFDTDRKRRRHENQTHDRNYICQTPSCHARFGTKGDLKRHQATHHPQLFPPTQLGCPRCPRVIRGRRDNLTRHLIRQHGMSAREAQQAVPESL